MENIITAIPSTIWFIKGKKTMFVTIQNDTIEIPLLFVSFKQKGSKYTFNTTYLDQILTGEITPNRESKVSGIFPGIINKKKIKTTFE